MTAIDLRPATPADEAFVNRLTRDVMRDYVTLAMQGFASLIPA